MLTNAQVKIMQKMIERLMKIRHQNGNDQNADIFVNISNAITCLLRASDYKNREKKG